MDAEEVNQITLSGDNAKLALQAAPGDKLCFPVPDAGVTDNEDGSATIEIAQGDLENLGSDYSQGKKDAEEEGEDTTPMPKSAAILKGK